MAERGLAVMIFVYTGAGGAKVPDDVVRVRVDPSVTSIPDRAFFQRKKLTEVELCEGLVEIGERSFWYCDHSITKINIPNSLRRIKDFAFSYSLRCPIQLHDGIESIGEWAFGSCIFTNFRVPPLITVIHESMLYNCKSIFSLELHEAVTEIGEYAFFNCHCLRNVAFPPSAVFDDYVLLYDGKEDYDIFADLQLLFGDSNAAIIRELQHRFDGLPIHRIVYYQSYHQGVLQKLIAAINMRSGQHRTLCSTLDPTGNQQDCLGMTPLHILTCSSMHNLQLYHLIVEKYPSNLVTEDRWGALPLMYAFWGAAPTEIIQFLLESYHSFYPGHVFNWTKMVDTMGRCDTPKERIENLLQVKHIHFPDQPIDWGYLLDKFAASPLYCLRVPFRDRMQFLVMCGLSERVEALAFKVWRDHITNMIYTAEFKHTIQSGNQNSISLIHTICSKVDHFEDELPKLKETTSILELVLWKTRINDNGHKWGTAPCQKTIKTDEASIRRQCRITCGADVIIRHVLPYLISTEDKESD